MWLFHPISLCAPLPRHLQQAALHHPRSAESSQLPGNPSPAETSHDSPGWGRRDWRKGRRCGFGPVRSPGCNRPLALPQHTTPSLTHTCKMHKATVHFYTQRDKQEKKRKERDRRGFQSLRFRVIIWISVRVINWSNLCAISSDSMYGSWFHYTVTLITFRAS